MQQDAVVALDGVSLSLDRQLVFGSVSLEIPRASVVSVRGTNGSGKTSLLRLLCGVCAPTTGTQLGPSSCTYVPAAITAPRLRGRVRRRNGRRAKSWRWGVPISDLCNSDRLGIG